METRYLIVGGGVSGLSLANFIDSDEVLILERDGELGGYCKTVAQDGFVWDYSGHFFHFRDPEIESWLVGRMAPGEVSRVVKDARIWFKGQWVDFPFQKNIHQLPREDFIDCLYELRFRPRGQGTAASFGQMLVERFGRGIAARFLVPYNEKLYACDLDDLDADAMGRFFPHADEDAIIRNFKHPDNTSYNDTFTYPKGGAIRYIEALAAGVDASAIALGEGVEGIDLRRKVARTSLGREIGFEVLISSAPFDRLLAMSGLAHDPGIFTSNKVAVFNLGFDAKGVEGVHWAYFPECEFVFYRVGFYDNILGGDRMSLYVEVGLRTGEAVEVEALRARVLEDLALAGIVAGHRLVSWHHVVLDPAYVHITRRSQEAVAHYKGLLQARGVYSVGRYGGWTYCSIEDNILESRALARMFNTLDREAT